MDKKNISISFIDAGQTFDWGKTSEDYAKYRDIYPKEFYQHILKLGLCKDGSEFWILAQGREFCHEICMNTGQNGWVQILQKTRLNRQKNLLKRVAWKNACM